MSQEKVLIKQNLTLLVNSSDFSPRKSYKTIADASCGDGVLDISVRIAGTFIKAPY